ncbi:helix-turn-helix domain-containing protein [Ktedonosporobacter rubrisoli]|nr:helix-turn-helix domain-containing protein [Ktedonosporobacter rubrisoli]
MAENEDLLEIAIPGHVSAQKAAQILGVSADRIYKYIQDGRLHSRQVGHLHMIPIEDVEAFQRQPSGRVRKQPPAWRLYRSNIQLGSTAIRVQIRPGQQEAFQEKLKALLEQQAHLLTGSIQRYIFEDEDAPASVQIWLVWKSNELPDTATHEQELAALQAELADVLDWDTAQFSHLHGLLYT